MTKTLIKVAVIALFAGTFASEGMAKSSFSKASNSSTVVAIGVGTTYGVSGGAVLGNSNSKSMSVGGNSGKSGGSAGGIAGGLGIDGGRRGPDVTAGFAAGGVTSSASTN